MFYSNNSVPKVDLFILTTNTSYGHVMNEHWLRITGLKESLSVS